MGEGVGDTLLVGVLLGVTLGEGETLGEALLEALLEGERLILFDNEGDSAGGVVGTTGITGVTTVGGSCGG